jgi:tetratricopeptide (TPR) repeat protein
MASDDRTKQNGTDRSKLLEEIRRRAEEAELKRIEEEEQERKGASSQKAPPSSTRPQPSQKVPPSKQKSSEPTARAPEKPSQKKPPAAPRAPQPSQQKPPTQKSAPLPAAPPPPEPKGPAPFPAPFPVPSSESISTPAKAAREQRAAVLRERLVIALDRGKPDKAAELLAELTTLIDDTAEIEQYRARLMEVQQRKEPPKKVVSEVRPKEPPPEDRATREAKKKRIAELLEKADSLYQGEKYEKGIQAIDELFAIDPENDDAKQLREQIQKAHDLAIKIQQEEKKRKADDAAVVRPVEAPRPVVHDKDVWGTSTSPTSDVGYELPPEEKGPVGPPKRPTVEVLAERLSNVKIPVRPVIITASIIVVALVAYFVVDSIRNTVAPPKYSLLIMPAAPRGGDTAFAWVADGVTEDLIRDCEAVNELRVIGSVTALGFRNSGLEPLQLARGVGANYYLKWSIIQDGDRVIVQPSFYDTPAPQRPVWASQYQTSLRELPGVRLELVNRLASVMGVKISAEEAAAFRRFKVPDQRAYAQYLRARTYLRVPQSADLSAATAMLEDATRIDSTFVDAFTALGWAHVLSYEAASEVIPTHLAQASVCVQRAIALGARNAETFRVWGLIEQYRGEYDKTVERLEQAVSVSPADAESQRRLAVAYVIRNRADAAIKVAAHAAADDPGNVDSYTVLGLVHQFKGDYRSALRAYEYGLRYARDRSEYASGFYADVLVYVLQSERATDVLNDRLARVRDSARDNYKLGRVEQSAGKPKQEWQGVLMRAKTLLQAHLSTDPRDAGALSLLALVHTRLGEFKDALAANSRAQQLSPNNIEVLYNTARMYALQREKTQAYEYLNKAVSRRYSLAAILDMDFFNLHSEPEFIGAITR